LRPFFGAGREGHRALRAGGAGGTAVSHPLDPHVGAAILAAMAPFFAYVGWRYRPRADEEILPLHMVMFVVGFTMLFLVIVVVARVLVRPVPH